MTALVATALFLLLQTATPATTPPRPDHEVAPPTAKTKGKASPALSNSIASPEQDKTRVIEVCPLAPNLGEPEGENISLVAKDFISVAAAMPEDKYSFSPATGEFKNGRTFAQQVIHVADANFLYAYPLASNEQAPEDIFKKPSTKAEILAYLRDSFDALEKADATFSDRVRECQKTAEKVLPLSVREKVFDTAVEGWFMPSGSFAGTGTLGLAATHCRVHRRQMIEYERVTGIVLASPPI